MFEKYDSKYDEALKVEMKKFSSRENNRKYTVRDRCDYANLIFIQFIPDYVTEKYLFINFDEKDLWKSLLRE